MKPVRAWKEVLNDWLPELAEKLKRPESELQSQGLGASDFSPSRSVEVRFPFGLVHRFTFAFAVVRPSTGEAAVFSEHAGYVEFQLVEDCVIAEIHEDIYYRHEA
jgi:hypothetical protein